VNTKTYFHPSLSSIHEVVDIKHLLDDNKL